MSSLRSVVSIVQSPNSSPAAPHHSSAQMKAKQCQKLAGLKTALVASGFKTLNEQAAVLDLCRSSTWKVLKSDHKQSGLNAGTINRMLASPNLPPKARKIIEEYVLEKLLGAYGHAPKSLKAFRLQLGLPMQPVGVDVPASQKEPLRGTVPQLFAHDQI